MTAETMARCRICGFTGPLVTPGIYRTSAGKYLTIARCQDKLACDTRKGARPPRGEPDAA